MTQDEKALLEQLQKKHNRELANERKRLRRQFAKLVKEEFGHDIAYVRNAVTYYERIELKRKAQG